MWLSKPVLKELVLGSEKCLTYVNYSTKILATFFERRFEMYKFEYRKYRKGWQNTLIHTFRSMGVRTHHAEGQMASIKRLQTITKEEFRQRKQTGMTNLYYFLALTKVVKVNHTGECNVQACRYFSERFGRGCRENILYNTLIHKNLMEIYKKKK